MRIAITGGTGFVGGHLARALAADGHHLVLIARGADERDHTIRRLPNATFHPAATDDEERLAGSEEMSLTEAVRRVARAVGRRPLTFPLPLWFHYAFAWFCERTMRIPLISIAQVRILSEGVVEPLPACRDLPPDLKPVRPFTPEQIRAGLPEAKAFGLADCRCSIFRSRKA
jgi:uncharacterized protein YbjT (DUF2867 family)